MRSGCPSRSNKIWGVYPRASSARVCRAGGRRAAQNFSAWAAPIGASAGSMLARWAARPGASRNGGNPPFLDVAGVDVARRHVARASQGVGITRLSRAARQMANLTTGGADGATTPRRAGRDRAGRQGGAPLSARRARPYARRARPDGISENLRGRLTEGQSDVRIGRKSQFTQMGSGVQTDRGSQRVLARGVDSGRCVSGLGQGGAFGPLDAGKRRTLWSGACGVN